MRNELSGELKKECALFAYGWQSIGETTRPYLFLEVKTTQTSDFKANIEKCKNALMMQVCMNDECHECRVHADKTDRQRSIGRWTDVAVQPDTWQEIFHNG